jgi:hypothetical protein
MSSLQQHLADIEANLIAQLCELNELRERVRKALQFVPKSEELPKPWTGQGEISPASPEMEL